MKKMNLGNEATDDDEPLIALLKMSFKEEPPHEFSEEVMTKFLALSAEEKKVQEPVKISLLIMGLLALFLLVAMFSMNITGISFSMPASEFGTYKIPNFREQNLWYLIAPLFLVLALTLLFQLENRVSRKLIP